jgi:hypothetical protein
MSTSSPQVLLQHHLKQLRLPTFYKEYEKLAQACAAEGVDHPRYLLRLSELELLDCERRTMELARCEFILRRENVIALGNSGTGKTHMPWPWGWQRASAAAP